MRIELDVKEGVITVGGCKMSLEVLETLAVPDEHFVYRFTRDGETTKVEKIPADLIIWRQPN